MPQKKRAVIKLLMPIIKMMLSKQCYYLCFLRGVFTHFLRKPILTELFVNEADVIGFKNKYHLPVEKSPCPVDGYTKRQYVKELIRTLNHEHPGVKERMFTAILNGNLDGWETFLKK